MSKGGLRTVLSRLGDLFPDLEQLISFADQRRVRGKPEQVVAESLRATVGIINAQADLTGGEDESDGAEPLDSA